MAEETWQEESRPDYLSIYNERVILKLAGLDKNFTWSQLEGKYRRILPYGLYVSFSLENYGLIVFSINHIKKTISFERIPIFWNSNYEDSVLWLLRAIHSASEMNFETLKIISMNNENRWISKWHKQLLTFGFRMSEDGLIKFKEKIIAFNPDIKDLEELLSTPKGASFWHDNGWSWTAIFELNKNSSCRLKFAKFLLNFKKHRLNR